MHGGPFSVVFVLTTVPADDADAAHPQVQGQRDAAARGGACAGRAAARTGVTPRAIAMRVAENGAKPRRRSARTGNVAKRNVV